MGKYATIPWISPITNHLWLEPNKTNLCTKKRNLKWNSWKWTQHSIWTSNRRRDWYFKDSSLYLFTINLCEVWLLYRRADSGQKYPLKLEYNSCWTLDGSYDHEHGIRSDWRTYQNEFVDFYHLPWRLRSLLSRHNPNRSFIWVWMFLPVSQM